MPDQEKALESLCKNASKYIKDFGDPRVLNLSKAWCSRAGTAQVSGSQIIWDSSEELLEEAFPNAIFRSDPRGEGGRSNAS